MKRAETCSCSLRNKLYTYLYHHIVVLDKYIHSILVENSEFCKQAKYILLSITTFYIICYICGNQVELRGNLIKLRAYLLRF